ncbi:hypothetical protein ACIRL0_32750 [Streptomyces sp. NPDC102365]|uniref:hypothetical protein n=1 Tax=Streptomyces sp. NPDC102365 TaxID=3366162 RepID=UPI00382893B3
MSEKRADLTGPAVSNTHMTACETETTTDTSRTPLRQPRLAPVVERSLDRVRAVMLPTAVLTTATALILQALV